MTKALVSYATRKAMNSSATSHCEIFSWVRSSAGRSYFLEQEVMPGRNWPPGEKSMTEAMIPVYNKRNSQLARPRSGRKQRTSGLEGSTVTERIPRTRTAQKVVGPSRHQRIGGQTR